MNKKNKKIIFITSLFTFITFIALIIAVIFMFFKNQKEIFKYKDNMLHEIEYERTYKKLIGDFFEKKENKEYVELIDQSVKNDIKNKKEKIKHEENFKDLWQKQLLEENVITEEDLYEKLKYIHQNETFYDIFFQEKEEEMFNEYVSETKPIHLIHFILKINNDEKYKFDNKISNLESKKIFDVVTKMEESNINLNHFEKIKNKLNLNYVNKTSEEIIDKIIDCNTLLNENEENDEFKLIIFLKKNENKNKIKMHKVPYELIFVLNNQKYGFKFNNNKKILNIETKEQCEKNCVKMDKNGFANVELLPKTITKITNPMDDTDHENYFVRNIMFNKYFKYGFNKISNEILPFSIQIENHSDESKYILSTNEKIRQKPETRKIIKNENNNLFLFRDNKNIHFLYVLYDFGDNFKKTKEYIKKVSSNKEEEYNKINILKKKVRNFNVAKIQKNVFEYLLNQTVKDVNKQKKIKEKFKKMFENKIQANEILKEIKIKEKIKEYQDKIDFEKENKSDKLFYQIIFNK